MNGLTLWVIVCSAVLVARLINACVSIVVMNTNWYHKLVTRVSIGMAKDLEVIDDETEEEMMDYIKDH